MPVATEPKQEVEVIKKEIQAYVGGLPMKVSNQAEMEDAVGKVLAARKDVKAKEKEIDEKLKIPEAKKLADDAKANYTNLRSLKMTLLSPFLEAIQQTDRLISAWRQKEAARIAAEQAKANQKYEENRAKAEAKGKDTDSIKPMKIFQEPPKTIKTEHGAYTTRVEKELVITDEKEIPGYEHVMQAGPYWKVELNKKALEAALRGGAKVPGAVLQEKYGSAARV